MEITLILSVFVPKSPVTIVLLSLNLLVTAAVFSVYYMRAPFVSAARHGSAAFSFNNITCVCVCADARAESRSAPANAVFRARIGPIYIRSRRCCGGGHGKAGEQRRRRCYITAPERGPRSSIPRPSFPPSHRLRRRFFIEFFFLSFSSLSLGGVVFSVLLRLAPCQVFMRRSILFMVMGWREDKVPKADFCWVI